MAEDHVRAEASLAHIQSAVEKAVAELQGQLKQVQAKGDQIQTARIESQIAQLRALSPNAAEVEKAEAALKRQGDELTRNAQLALFELDALKQQTRQLQEQAALRSRQQRQLPLPGLGPARQESPLVVPRTQAEHAAGQQALNQALREDADLRRQAYNLEERQLTAEKERLLNQRAIAAAQRQAYREGVGAGAAGGVLEQGVRDRMAARPAGYSGEWSKANEQAMHYKTTLGEYDALANRAGTSTRNLETALRRAAVAEEQSSNALRRHGALTTEYLSALARGETTLSEFGYQLGATTAKFAGWTAAAAGTYALFGAVHEFGKGAADAATGVDKLKRTIDGLDPQKATAAIQGLSQQTNVPIGEAADAMFQYSRAFHTVEDASAAAHDGLAVFKLDQVKIQDSMKLSTLVLQQFGATAQDQHSLWDMLAAGQRQYNARISETVPLIRAAGAAAKNAGGDLTSLAQVAVLATRTYPGQGANVGTAIARGVAQQIPQQLPELQKRFGIGIGEGPQDSFKILQEAILKSASLGDNDRRDLAKMVLQTRFGSRYAGLFSPEAAAFLQKEQGGGPGSITPAATKGSLDEELKKETQTFRERMHSFVNEMQRFGAAIGASGILTNLGHLVSGITSLGGSIRGVVTEFDQLPNASKSIIETLLALRLTMLAMSHTRFGASIPGSRFFRIPGVDEDYESQRMRAELARGNRGAIDATGTGLQQTNAALRSTAQQRLTLARETEQLQAQIGTADKGSEEQMARHNANTLKLIALEREQIALESQRNTARATLTELEKQQLGLTSMNRRTRYDSSQVRAMGAGIDTGEMAGLSEEKQQQTILASQRSRLAGQRRLLDSAGGAEREAIQQNIAALQGNIHTTMGQISAAREAESGSKTLAGRLRGLGERLGGLAAAMDPLTLAIIAVPIAYDAIKNAVEKGDKAVESAKKTMATPVTGAQDLAKQAAELQKQAAAQQDIGHGKVSGSPLGILQNAQHGYQRLFNLLGGGLAKGAELESQGQSFQNITDLYNHAAQRFERDAPGLFKTAQGQRKLYQESQRLKQSFAAVLQSSGLPQAEIDKLYQAFINQLQREYAQVAQKDPKHGSSPFARLENMKLPDIQKEVQGIDDFAKIYGANSKSLRKAAEDYAFAVNKFGKDGNSKDLQTLYSMQQNFISAVSKDVQDKLRASESSTTFSGQQGNIQAALGVIEQARQQERRSLNEIIAYNHGNAKAIDRAKKAADQVFAQLNDQLKQAIQQDLDLIKTQGDVRTSQIGGISPEADLARAQSNLQTLRDQLAKAKQDGADYRVIGGLIAQIGTANQALIKQRIDNARALLEAQGQLATASITGIGPEADIARARQDVTNAQNLLSYDQRTGAGQTKVIQDQVALDNSIRALNQQLQQRAQQIHQQMAALIQSQTQLAQSQTLDPIKQAREQLQGDIQVLSTIHRGDYQSAREYQTAINQAQAKINEDRIKLRDQITQTQLSTLQFEFNTQRIGDQQYINALQHILRTAKLTRDERQRILEQIYQLRHQAGNLDLNVGNIKLPSIYEIRRAIGLGKRGEIPGAQNTVINHSAVVNVYVRNAGAARAVGTVIDNHLNTSVRSAMRARGVI